MEVDDTKSVSETIESSSAASLSLPQPEDTSVKAVEITSSATNEVQQLESDKPAVENQLEEVKDSIEPPIEAVKNEEKLNANESEETTDNVELEKPNESMISSSSEENMETAPESEVDQSDTSVSVAPKETPVDPKPCVSLFANIRYHILNSKAIDVESQLDANGAYKEPYLGSFVTHVICDDHDASSDYSEAKEVFELPIVNVSLFLIQLGSQIIF